MQTILAPEPAPAGVADFLDEMPYQPGNSSSTLIPWHTIDARGRIRTGNQWPFTIDTSHVTSCAAVPGECAPVDCGQPGENWIPDALPAPTLRIPRFTAGVEPIANPNRAPHTPARCERPMPHSAPEPVTAFVRGSTALALAEAPRTVRFAAELEPTPLLDVAASALPACHQWAPVPPPEPVAAFVQASAARVAVYAPRTLLFTVRLEAAPPPEFAVDACHLETPGFATPDAGEASADAPQPAYAAGVEHARVPRMPVPEFTADLEPLPVLDVPLNPPAMCLRWMPAPAADPVFSHIRTSAAPAVMVALAVRTPEFDMPAAAPELAPVDLTQAMPHVEAPVAGVAAAVSKAPLEWIHTAAAVRLPAVPAAAQQLFAQAVSAATALPEAAEGLPQGAQQGEPVTVARVPLAEVGAPQVFVEAVPAMGRVAPVPAPAVQQSVPVASVAARMAPGTTVLMLPFMQAASRERMRPSLSARHLTQEVQKPKAAGPRLVTPQPIATLVVTPPDMSSQHVESGLPHPGLVSVEYYSQRLRGTPVCGTEWITPRPTLMPPLFQLSAALEKLETPVVAPKPVRPGFGKLRTMPAVKRPPSVLMVAGRVAAAFLMAASLWVGVARFRGDRRLTAQAETPSGEVVVSPGHRAGVAGALTGGTPPQPAAKGPVAWVRRTLAHRAALKIADDFRSMDNWDGEANVRPAGWTRHADGYVKTGALALFHPTLKFTDCKLEFFGQIESKSIGWTVRAADAMNYHAMKLTVVEAGMRPFVALVHYDVVGGKSGHRTQTPLNIMVHNNQPMQFSVDVHGSRVVTSIDGEEVDSFIDNTLVAGGVGFFSDVGERARLYWMRVSRNDDWLGHVCAMLADGAAEGRTARLRGPRLPGGAPAPGLPGGGETTSMAGVWIALPLLVRTARRARLFKTSRSEPWNTQAEAEATWTVCPCRRA